MRVAIVLDQCAALFVAREFNCIWVDGGHGSEESISFVNDDRLVLVISSGGNLRVRTWFDVSVASDHGEFNVMSIVVAGLFRASSGWSGLHSIVVVLGKMSVDRNTSITVDVLGRSTISVAGRSLEWASVWVSGWFADLGLVRTGVIRFTRRWSRLFVVTTLWLWSRLLVTTLRLWSRLLVTTLRLWLRRIVTRTLRSYIVVRVAIIGD